MPDVGIMGRIACRPFSVQDGPWTVSGRSRSSIWYHFGVLGRTYDYRGVSFFSIRGLGGKGCFQNTVRSRLEDLGPLPPGGVGWELNVISEPPKGEEKRRGK